MYSGLNPLNSLDIISAVTGLRLMRTILEKIRTARRPTTKKEVRSFLGLGNYYRAHIPMFAAVAAPLTDLMRKGQPNKIRWGQAQEKAYSSLRDFLLKRPILKLPDHSKPYELMHRTAGWVPPSCNSMMRDYIQWRMQVRNSHQLRPNIQL